jgi:hypothetical protein
MIVEFRVAKHSVIPNRNTIEVWYDGKFIASIYGYDGAGVGAGIRIVSKHPAIPNGPFVTYDNNKPVGITEVTFATKDIY